MALLPPPSAAEGGVTPSPAPPASFLNDVASLRLPRGNTFTSFHSTVLRGVAPVRAFEGLYLPEAGAANLSAYKPACDFELIPLGGDDQTRTLEPQMMDAKDGAWNAPQPLLAALSAQNAWPFVSHFRFVERVPVLWGLFTHRVPIEAWRACDRATLFARYSSVASGGSVRVWKYAWITPLEAGVGQGQGGCVVHEHIVGVISQSLFRSMAEKSCRELHSEHLGQFPSLFDANAEVVPEVAAAHAAVAAATKAEEEASAGGAAADKVLGDQKDGEAPAPAQKGS